MNEGLGNSKHLTADHATMSLQALIHGWTIGKLASRLGLSAAAAAAAAKPITNSLSTLFPQFVSYTICACRRMEGMEKAGA